MPKLDDGEPSSTRASATGVNVTVVRGAAGVVTSAALLSTERLPAASSAFTVYSYVVCGSTVVSEKLDTFPVVARSCPSR